MGRVFLILLALLPFGAAAQPISVPFDWPAGAGGLGFVDAVTPAGALIDAFRQPGDPDDTASIVAAAAVGIPVLCGPRIYRVANVAIGAMPSFSLRGVPGCVIQRIGASGSQFFSIAATVVEIDGVTFDMNRAAVSANQWGVFIGACGQTVTIRRSVFKNNSGSLGGGLAHVCTSGTTSTGSFSITDSEFTGNAWNALYLGSVRNGIVARNHVHDNDAVGIHVSAYGSASATNYAADIRIDGGNRVTANGSHGVSVGSAAAPYSFGTPAALRIAVANNTLIDNTKYGVLLLGDYLSATGNVIGQSSAAVSVFGGIDGFARYGLIEGNSITFPAAPWGIDFGGSVQMTVRANVISMGQGVALNAGGNQNSVWSGNHLLLSGTATGVQVYNVEADGAGGVFPTVASGTTFEANQIDMVGSGTTGMKFLDNAGGSSGAAAMVVRGNRFNLSGAGTGPVQDIVWYGAAGSIIIDKNQHNGATSSFVDPLGNGDVVFDLVFLGGTIQGISSTTDIRQIVPPVVETYGGGGSVLWITPTAGGSGHTGATTIAVSGTGCTGQAATPQIVSGVIVGVKMMAFGSGCSGAVTASATGAGSGATFSVGTTPQVPAGATLRYLSAATHALRNSGGAVRILGGPLQLATGTAVDLQALTSAFWVPLSFTVPAFAVADLPACGSNNNGAAANVTGSVTGKWQARCNGTNWLWPDGTVVVD